jgi:hypothetical protein
MVLGLADLGVPIPRDPETGHYPEVDDDWTHVGAERLGDYRMKTFQGAFHLNYDYSMWYGYAKMKKTWWRSANWIATRRPDTRSSLKLGRSLDAGGVSPRIRLRIRSPHGCVGHGDGHGDGPRAHILINR